MSKRYFVAENDSRAAPYAVPYDGREVMLHWANKDQALKNFTFDLTAVQPKEQSPQSGFEFQPAATAPLKRTPPPFSTDSTALLAGHLITIGDFVWHDHPAVDPNPVLRGTISRGWIMAS